MHRYKTLMVGLARTPADAGLIRYAAMVARLGTASDVRFVHVLPSAANPAVAHDREPSVAHDHDRALADMHAEVQSSFGGVGETIKVSYDVLRGTLVDQLLVCAAEKHVDLLLLGHSPDTRRRRSLARRMAMKAPCSVWMVPEGAASELRRILVPIDFSDNAADAMRVATSMAKLSGHTECLALHVYFDEAVTTYEGYDQVLRGQEEQAYRQFIAPIDLQGVKVTPLFEEGANVAHAIGRVAEGQGADLIVMATRGRSRSAAILLGSATEEMIIESRVPLLAVKHFGARMGVLQSLLDRKFWRQGELRAD